MKKELSYIILLFVLIACSAPKETLGSFEGKLVYAVTSTLNNPDKSDSINFQVVYAKDSMLRIDSFTPIGKQIYIKHIPKNKAYILMDIGIKKIAIQTIQDTTKKGERYIFKNTMGKETFGGRKANNIKVTDVVYDTTMTMNYIKEIPGKYSTAIEGMPGLPVNYSLNVSGMWVTYKLKSIEERSIDIDLFGIPSDYEIITLDEFIEIIEN